MKIQFCHAKQYKKQQQAVSCYLGACRKSQAKAQGRIYKFWDSAKVFKKAYPILCPHHFLADTAFP